MKEFKDKIVGYATFSIVLFLHVYFALLLGTKSAFAQTEAPAPAKVEQKVEQVEKAKPVQAPKPPPKPPKVEDTEINIKFDAKEGVTVKGIDKMVERLEAIDRKHGGDDEDTAEVSADGDSLKIKKRIRHYDDEGEEDHSSRRRNAFASRQVIVPLALFFCILAPILAYMYFQYRSRREALETVRMFLEKGQPIPTELMSTLKPGNTSAANEWDGYQSHLLKGLKPIFWGIGIATFFVFTTFDVTEWFFGVIFIIIGAYHITKSHLIQKDKEKNPQPVVADSTKTDSKL